MKVVVCGTYADLTRFKEVLRRAKSKFGKDNVFPDEKHLIRSMPCIEAHHEGKVETPEIRRLRSELMKAYFSQIDVADLVLVMNEKRGKEYYGVGTTLELGYAIAKNKRVQFTMKPTNANIMSLLLTLN
jgi:nucleoside 2-deoxyribosyltransferase